MALNSTTETKLPAGQTNDFEAIVEESRKKIQETPIEEPKIKRKVGRPPGSFKKRPDGPQTAQTQQPQVAPPQDQVNVVGLLEPPLIAISKIPAHRTQIPELALSPEEAHMCAVSLNEVLNAFIPDINSMSPKTAAVLGACVCFGSVGFQKMAIYNAKIEERKPKENPEEQAQTEAAKLQSDSPVNSQEYFQRIKQ